MAQRHSIGSTTEIEGRIFESYWEHSEDPLFFDHVSHSLQTLPIE